MKLFKKKPTLTAYYMIRLNRLSLALEIWSGFRSEVIQFDFNTGKGRVRINDEEKDIFVNVDVWEEKPFDNLVHFTVDGSEIQVAHFKDGEIEVSSEAWPTMMTAYGLQNYVWVGTSHLDRRLDLYFRKKLKSEAEKLGLTWEEFLNPPVAA